MSERLDNLKELVRYGTLLTVTLPARVLDESVTHSDIIKNVSKSFNALMEDDDLYFSVRECGDEMWVTVGLDANSDMDRSIITDLMEWGKLNQCLKESNRRLAEIKEEYSEESDKLLKEARRILDETGEDIIKARYGGNSDKTRKKYVEESLMDLTREKKELECYVSEDAMRVKYLKELIRTKRFLMEVEK